MINRMKHLLKIAALLVGLAFMGAAVGTATQPVADVQAFCENDKCQGGSCDDGLAGHACNDLGEGKCCTYHCGDDPCGEN